MPKCVLVEIFKSAHLSFNYTDSQVLSGRFDIDIIQRQMQHNGHKTPFYYWRIRIHLRVYHVI